MKQLELNFNKQSPTNYNTTTSEELQQSRGLSSINPQIQSTNYETLDCELRLKRLKKYSSDKRDYLEVGFRTVDSLKWAQKYFENVSGTDISHLSVEVANELGYTTFQHDLMSEEKISENKWDVIGCYHVLEHTHCPEIVLQKLIDISHDGTIIQLEVPIENISQPRIEFAYLFTFHSGDLETLCEETLQMTILQNPSPGNVIVRVNKI